jgi:hypothetical protein
VLLKLEASTLGWLKKVVCVLQSSSFHSFTHSAFVSGALDWATDAAPGPTDWSAEPTGGATGWGADAPAQSSGWD